MRNLNSRLVMEFLSEQGYDPIEKTYVAYTPLENYMCIAAAESYDNETEENSAQIAVEAVLTAFEKKPSLKRLGEYIRYANEQVALHSIRCQLKVSLTVLVSDYTRMRYAVCGNTRMFVLYENLIIHASKTQTAYQQMLDEEALPPDKLDGSQIHNLTEYLGKDVRARPFISKITPLQEGSTILFATSNLWGRLSEIEILDAYEYTKTGQEFLEILQELLLSFQDEDDQKIGSFTAAILYIEKTYHEDVQKKKKRKRLLIIAAVAVLAVAFLVCIVILCIRASDRSRMKEIEKHGTKGSRYLGYENYEKALEEYETAVELSDKLNLHNWQYIERKEELIENMAGRENVLSMLLEAQAAFSSASYEQAEKLYAQVQKEAAWQGLAVLSADAGRKIDEIHVKKQILQHISIGDMYQASEDYEEALGQYGQALEALSGSMDLETQSDVQAKIYAIRQKQKEEQQAQEDAKKAEEEAKQEEEQKKQEEEQKKQEEKEAEKQAAANKAVIKINTLIVNANGALDEGRTARARELYEQALARYNKFSGSSEDADKLYQDIITLRQAITEAEVKAAEQAKEDRIAQAAMYALQAKETARSKDTKTARQLYDKALAIYKEQNIWDERTEAVYNEIDALENGSAQQPAENTPSNDGAGTGEQAG